MIEPKNIVFTKEIYRGDERYYVDTEGLEYISATTLLSRYEDTEKLLEYRAKKGAAQFDKDRDDGIERGKLAHAQVENYLIYGVDPPEKSYAERAIKRFYDHVEILNIEKEIIFKDDKVRFAGRYDALVEIKENQLQIKDSELFIPSGKYIVDLKTKKSMPNLKETCRFFKNVLQGSAYVGAVESMTEEEISGILLLYVAPRSVRILHVDRERLEFYWKHVYKMLLDHYEVEPMKYNWNQMMLASEASYDVASGCMYSYLPDEVYLYYDVAVSDVAVA